MSEVENFKEVMKTYNVPVYEKDNTLLVKLKDIALILKLTARSRAVTKFAQDELQKISMPTKGGPQIQCCLTIKGLKRLLCHSRSSEASKLAKQIGMEIIYKLEPAEVTFLNAIEQCFEGEQIIRQYSVDGKYFIDLYFVEHKIAVEFDEKHHASSQHKENDLIRQDYIETALGCKFIRVKDVQVEIFKVCNEINTLITEAKRLAIRRKAVEIQNQQAKNVSKALDLIKSLIQLDSTNLPERRQRNLESSVDSQHIRTVCQLPQHQSELESQQATPNVQAAQITRDIQVTRESFPLPVFPPAIDDMCEFYNSWKSEMQPKLEAHVKRFKRPQWSKCFAKESSAHKLRYEKTYNWLNYLDTLDAQQVQQVIQLMTTFADENGLSHSSMVKQVFYLMVRPDSLKPKGFQGLCDDLLKRLKELNIEPPPNVVKQVHTYKPKDTNVTSKTNEAVETSQADAS